MHRSTSRSPAATARIEEILQNGQSIESSIVELMDVVRIILACVAFAVFHSMTVSEGYERLARRAMGDRAFDVYHRLLFTAYTGVAFVLVVLSLRSVPDAPLFRLDGWSWLLCRAVQVGGAAFLLWTPWDLKEFVGLRQWDRRGAPAAARNERLFTGKAYGVVRHPLYLGFSAILAANPVQSRNTAITTAMVILYFYVGTFFEERRLLRKFGDDYRAYQERVPRFLPVGRCFGLRRTHRP
jgi:protein-S-isoprenylcysteine O-methyltransferase Ste14